jgi:hypothetical protein
MNTDINEALLRSTTAGLDLIDIAIKDAIKRREKSLQERTEKDRDNECE